MFSGAVFAVGSALCGGRLVGRIVEFLLRFQGFGGGLIMPVGMSVLAQTAGPRQMGRAMSVICVPMLLEAVFAPVLGGLIVTNVRGNERL